MFSAADRAALSFQASWTQRHALWGRGWLELRPGFMASFSELAVSSFNGASVHGPFTAADLAQDLRRIDATGFPYSLQSRPSEQADAGRVAQQLNLEPRDPVPLMLCERPPADPVIDGLVIRTLAPEEHGIHAAILAEAFGAPLQLSNELTPPVLLAPRNVWTLVGDFHGQPVTTAFVDVNQGVGDVHNVGTREAFRGRGFGAAITAAATRIAFDAGADLVMLLSSPMGVSVYERVGFRVAEHWSVWESGS